MPDPETLADFVDRFAAWWRAPDPEALPTVLGPDVHLAAPLTEETFGLLDAQEGFRTLLAGIPDLTGEVHRWGPHPDGVFIEFTLRGTIGDRTVAIRAVDDFLVGDDGLATERISYFDPSQLLG
ncbi:MAG TPA: nuclear transport factor 2 family protein [Acidimicrobiales bacterium]|nr:nuclear transport factor 2 family protein [Acidimicrobiales bacterium]